MQDKFMVVADGSVRSGKEQPLDANVLTPKGFKKMGEIEVGDIVITKEGKHTKVLEIFPQGEKDVWGITLGDGRYVECGLEHLWLTMTSETAKPVITSFKKILESKEKDPYFRNYLIPLCKPIEFSNKEDSGAYTYGVALATGEFKDDKCMLVSENIDCHYEIAEYIPSYRAEFRNGVGVGYIDIKYLKVQFRDILHYYINTRKEFFRGIVESRGVETNNGTTIFNKDKKVIDIIEELARGLGIYVVRDKYSPNNKLKFHFHRKAARIVNIEYVGKKECQCIMVEDESHTYLTDEYIPTHNTVSMSLSFVMFVMNTFNEMNAAICGKSVGAVRRNIIPTLKRMLMAIGYECIDHRSDNYLEVKNDNKINYIYLFGGKDESSADQIQGRVMPLLVEMLG